MVNTDNDRDVSEGIGQLECRNSGHDGQSAHPLLFTDISSIKALNAAWRKFSRGKKSRQDVSSYQQDLQPNISNLHELLVSGYYRHQPYQKFMIHDPKQRSIHKATVQDRVVHQSIVTATEPLFERRFIFDSYSCRAGKGTHAGVKRLYTFLRKVSNNDTRKVYILKCDIKKYFASIDHHILLGLIEHQVCDERTLELIRTILSSHGQESGCGIPLGNVTSQLFANIYLHELDWYVKQTLGVKYYARYCDDFVIVSDDKLYLRNIVGKIRQFLWEKLHLELHPYKITIRSWNQGIDFLGFVLRPHAVTIRNKTHKRILDRVSATNLSSYVGICSHADAYHISQILYMAAWRRGAGV